MPRPDLFAHPALGEALRHLRTLHAPFLRQADVAARMAAAGTPISVVWLSNLENGKGRPTHATLAALLRALDTSQEELDHLLRERPWEVREGAEWAGEAPLAAATPPPPARAASLAPLAEPRGGRAGERSAAGEGAPSASPGEGAPSALPGEAAPSASPGEAPSGSLAAEAAELGALFALLDPAARRAVLEDVRRRAGG
jgi:transcriptional regulator with XRE-family HTH domain